MFFPDSVRQVIERLESCGFEAYAVGGCVRDSLLGLIPNDWDLTTSARPEEVVACFSVPPFAAVTGNGLKHGTVTVLWYGDKKETFELTTYRCESGYSDSRRPDSVYFTSSLEQDLARRDFTVNAMAARPRSDGEELVDLYGGREDLERRLLRSVRDASERFSEDALRIMRGLRFAAVFGFQVEEKTASAMRALRKNLQKIAPERISVEFLKLLEGSFAGEVIDAYGDVFAMLLGTQLPLDCRGRFLNLPGPMARLALLFGETEPATAASVLRGLKCSGETIRAVTELLEGRALPLLPDERNVCLLLRRYCGDIRTFCRYRQAVGSEKTAVDAVLKTAEHILKTGACYTEKMLALNGNDLLSLGVKPGREVGQCIAWLFDSVISGRLENERAVLAKAVREHDSFCTGRNEKISEI